MTDFARFRDDAMGGDVRGHERNQPALNPKAHPRPVDESQPGDNLDSRDLHRFVVSLTDEQLAWAEHRAEEAGMLAYQWVQHVVDVEVQFAHANSNETRPVR